MHYTRYMSETSEKASDIDPSGLFSTYKSHPEESSDDTSPVLSQTVIERDRVEKNTAGKKVSLTDIPKYETSFQKYMYLLQVVINGFVRLSKVASWTIFGFGILFIVALATNTLNQAVDIINTTVLSKFGTSLTISSEVAIKKDEALTQNTNLTSNTLSTTPQASSSTSSATSESVVAKRRAILEARKAAKALEEQQKATEKIQ